MIAKLKLNRLLWAVTGGLAVVAAIAGIFDHRLGSTCTELLVVLEFQLYGL